MNGFFNTLFFNISLIINKLGIVLTVTFFTCTYSFAQTGPGGVGTSATNKLWLKADVGIEEAASDAAEDNDLITSWLDQSGSGNNATQAGANRPTYRTSIVNSRPIVRFDGTDDFFGSVFTTATQNATIFTVFSANQTGGAAPDGPLWQQNNASGYSGFFPKYSDGNQYLITTAGAYLSKASTFTQNTWYTTTALYNTGTTELWKDGALNHNVATNSYSLGAFTIGRRTTLSTNYFRGDISEIIYYNTPLNTAQHIIVNNYLAAKYGLTITGDKYAYQAAHSYDVAGIGYDDGSNSHTSAQSAGILTVNTASSLDVAGDYLLFGHDNGSLGSWTNTEVPSADANLKRIAREWRFDMTGTVGTVSLSLDTALLPTKDANYDFYLLWVDSDGDFSSGATYYPVTLSGGKYVATGVTIPDGAYVTVTTHRASISFTSTTSAADETSSPTLSVTLNYPSSRVITVVYSDAGTGTATGGGTDFTVAGSPVSIASGATSATFGITIIADAVEEVDETCIIQISAPSYGIIGTNATFTHTIYDVSNARKIDFLAATANGSEGVVTVAVTVQINSVDALNPTTVDYSVTGGTATSGGVDFTLASGTATIAAGATTTTFNIAVIEDLLDEANETIIITLSNPSINANRGTNLTHTYTINDNDASPTVQFLASTSTGDEGVTPALIYVSLSAPSGQNVTIDYVDAGTGSATSGGTDFTLAAGTATITAGSTSGTIPITITDDGTIESAETVNLTISNPVGATIGATTSHTYTITDNDVSLGGFTGPGGVGSSTFNKLWLKADVGIEEAASDAAEDNDLITSWLDQSGSGNNATQAGANRPTYRTSIVNSRPIVRFDGTDDFFGSVFTTATQNATIFTVFSANQTGGAAPDGPLWQQNNASGYSGFFPKYSDGNQYLITTAGAYLSKASTFTQNTWYTTTALYNTGTTELWKDGALNHNVATNSYSLGAFTIGRRTTLSTNYFRGDMSEIIYYNTALNTAQNSIVTNYLAAKYGLTITGDKYAYQAAHSYDVAGIGRDDASNTHVAAQSAGVLKVSNASSLGDADYLLFGHDNGSIASYTTTEAPNSGTNTQRLAREWRFDETGTMGTVSLSIDTALLPSKPAGYNQYVIWVDADGNFASGATAYQAALSGTSYIANNITITDGYYVAIGLIRTTVQFTATTGTGFENTPASIQVTIGSALTSNVTVDYTVSGTASSATDYILANGTLTILAGQTTANISPSLINDAVVENDETLILTLSAPSTGLVLGTNTVHTYTIQDDDNARKIDFLAATASGSEGTASVTVTVQINSVDITNPTTVVYTATGGTATGSGTDYTLASGTATVAANATTTTFNMTIIEDLLDEANETIIITLSSPTNSNIGTNLTYTYTINDNDASPTIQFLASTSTGDEGVTPALIYVSLSAPSGQNVTIDYVDAGTGSATSGGTDYTLAAGTATITAGSTSGTIPIVINDDGSIEASETVILTISNPVGATIGATTSHTYTITDNDVSLGGFTGPGGVGSSTFNKLWLKADVGIEEAASDAAEDNDLITSWLDQSGSGNNATQAGANRPTYRTSIVNSRPIVRFDGTDDFFGSVFTTATQNSTIFTVFSANHTGAATPDGPLWQQNNASGSSGFFPKYSDGNQYLITTAGAYLSKASTFSQNTWYTTTALYNTGTTELWKDGALNHNVATNSYSLGLFTIGRRTAVVTNYFRGDMSEIIYYNTALNTAQNSIVTNYLAAKYGLTITGDKYAYQAAHSYDVAGIGRDDASNTHVAAQSAGVLKVSNASSLGDADYLLFGHDNGSIASYTTTEAPNSGTNTQRLAREWRFDETGTMGTVSLSIDTALLPSKPAGYNQYVIWVDADGNFASGATAYQAALSGTSYIANNITIADGSYIAIGLIRTTVQFTATTGTGFENTPASIQVTIGSALTSNVTVDYTVSGTASSATDYILANGTLTILAGQTTANISPSLINDAVVENDETLILTLSAPSTGLVLGTNTVHTYTIQDDDNARKIDFLAATASGSEGTASVTVTVQINSVDITNPTTVVYTATGGTATGSGTDYTLASGTATVAANATTTTFNMTIIEDLLDEANETIIITLSSPTNSNIGTNLTYTYTINDNDASPTVQFLASTSSGDEGVTPALIYVSLSAPSGQNVTIDYVDAGTGSATSGGTDYTLAAGTATITAGSTSGTIPITITDDGTIESAETVNLTISNPVGATIGATTSHTYTITDNDVSLGGFTGPGGVGSSTFNKLWLKADVGIEEAASDAAEDNDLITSWLDQSGSGNNATQAGANRPTYRTSIVNSRPIVRFDGTDDFFGSVFTTATQNATIFTVFSANQTGGAAPDGPLWQQNNASGYSGFFPKYSDGNQYLITTAGAYLSKASTFTQNTWYTTTALYNTGTTELWKDGALNHNVATNSYSLGAFTIGRRTTLSTNYFRGDMSEIIYYNTALNTAQNSIVTNYLAAKYGLTITGDKYAYQAAHSYDVAGIGRDDASNTHVAAQSAGVLKVSNASSLGDADYLLFGHDNGSIASYTTTEAPNSGTNTQRLAREWRFDETGTMGTVSLSIDTALLPSKPAGYNQYVIWVDADGNFASGATAYQAALSGTSYIANNMTIADGSYIAIGLIRTTVQFTSTTGSGFENTAATIQVTLSNSMTTNVTVDYTLGVGTATSVTDYILANGTLTILAGQTTANINPSIINDVIVEADETIVLTLSSPSAGLVLGTNTSHTYSIQDDDNARKIDFLAATASGSEGTASVTVTVQINSVDITNPTTVVYTATAGTATSGGTDYTLASGTATVAANATTTTFNLTIVDDAIDEVNETVIITLSSPTNSNIGTNTTYTYTINDNDVAPTVQFTSSTATGSEGTTPGAFPLTLSAASGQDITLDYTVSGGAATGGGTDYTLANGTVTITAGNTTGSIDASIINDATSELSETIQITISNPTGATLGATTICTYTIIDDDASLGGFTGPGGVGGSTFNKLWLKADVGIEEAASDAAEDNDLITSWLDQSGSGNNATQAGANRPTYRTSIVNSRPVVRFDGTDDFFGNVFTTATQNSTIFTVFSANHTGAATPDGPLWQQNNASGSSGFFPKYSDGNQYLITTAGAYLSKASTFSQNTWYTTTALYNTGTTELWKDGALNHNVATNSYSLGPFTIGRRTAVVTNYFRGDMSEIIYYNTALNTAQHIIVNNYLAAKYGLTITNDKYAYQAAHSYDVAGIGYDDASNFHSTAQSAGILKIGTPGGMDAAGDYLLFGHDNAAITSWTATESPGAGIQRLAREWRFDESGSMGTVTVTVDITTLPALDASYNSYAVLIDADGDFSSGASAHILSLQGGNLYYKDAITITDGYYMTIAEMQNVSSGTGDFNDPTKWLTGVVPATGQNITIVSPHVITLTANQTVGSITVALGATLNLGSNTLTLDGIGGALNVAGTFNPGTGTVNYAAAGAQCISALTYNNLSIGGSGTKTLCGAVDVNGNLSITAGTLDADITNNYAINLAGNFSNSGTFTARSGTVTLDGTSAQTITGVTTFGSLTINNTNATAPQITLNSQIYINGALTLTDGILLTTAVNSISMNSGSTTTIGSADSYVNGPMSYDVAASGVTTINFPVGKSPSWRPVVLNVTHSDAVSASYTTEMFNTSAEGLGYTLPTTISRVSRVRYWQIDRTATANFTSATIRLYYDTDDGVTQKDSLVVAKTIGNGTAWNDFNGVATLNGTGSILSTPFTSFSKFTFGNKSGGSNPLPVELLSFSAQKVQKTVVLDWITASEVNNRHFEVERSEDNETYFPIGYVRSKKENSNEKLSYQFVDEAPLIGLNYYRLKQVDFDGNYDYLPVRVVSFKIKERKLFDVYPNPVTIHQPISIKSTHQFLPNKEVLVVLVDLNGKEYYSKVIITGDDGSFLEAIDVMDRIPSGTYIIKASDGAEIESKVVVVQ